MAVVVFDVDNNGVTVLIEKTDSIHFKDKNGVNIRRAESYPAGTVFVTGEVKINAIRGERE